MKAKNRNRMILLATMVLIAVCINSMFKFEPQESAKQAKPVVFVQPTITGDDENRVEKTAELPRRLVEPMEEPVITTEQVDTNSVALHELRGLKVSFRPVKPSASNGKQVK
jgi:hypothetical protein